MIFIIISAMSLFFGLYTMYTKTKNQQIESGFSTNFITTGTALIVTAFGTFSDKVFGLLSNEPVTNNLVQLGTGFILVIIGIWMKLYVKNKLSILNLLGAKERRIEEHRKDVGLNQFEFKEREVDLSVYAKKMNRERYEEATELIKLKMESFYSENREVKKGYTGTAPIPLTMFAGHCYKGAPTTEFFEYHKFDRKYMKLGVAKKRWFSSEKEYPELKLKQPLTTLNLENTEELVLGVSVTMEITPMQVQQFRSPFIELSIENPVHNAIMYEEQLQEYAKNIFDMIVELGSRPKVKKIHLVLSCQSCLAFELGKLLTTETYMKEVINYHYVNDPTPRYAWGVSFNRQGTKFIEC